MNEREISALISVPVHTLQKWRYKRLGPPFIKAGRNVLYEVAVVEAWLRDRVVATDRGS